MSKFTLAERTAIKSIVASLTIKRISDAAIQDEILKHTGKTVSRTSLYRTKQSIKRDSYKWYKTMREGEYEYIHEFKERIDEILALQRKHHQLIDSNEQNPTVQQTSLAELHRLNITLSNYFDVAPAIIGVGVGNGSTLPTTQQSKSSTTTTEGNNFIV